MRNISEKLRQIKALVKDSSNVEMRKIYSNFLRMHEEASAVMLHREDLYMSGAPHEHFSPFMIDLIQEHGGTNILDVGCGTGVNSIELIRRGFNCTGIEIDENYVRLAQRNIEAHHMQAEKLEFKDKSFDTAIMIEVLEHINDPDAALSEIARVTCKNLILSVPNIAPLETCVEQNMIMHHFFDSSHVNFFTPSMLERFLKQYFRHVRVGEFGQFFNLSGKKLFYHIFAIASFD